MDEDGVVTGTATAPSPVPGETIELEMDGQVSGTDVMLEATIDMGGVEVEVKMVGQIEDDVFSGEVTIREPGGVQVDTFEATRIPQERESDHSHEEPHCLEVR